MYLKYECNALFLCSWYRLHLKTIIKSYQKKKKIIILFGNIRFKTLLILSVVFVLNTFYRSKSINCRFYSPFAILSFALFSFYWYTYSSMTKIKIQSNFTIFLFFCFINVSWIFERISQHCLCLLLLLLAHISTILPCVFVFHVCNTSIAHIIPVSSSIIVFLYYFKI